jgi:MFS family permease
MLALPQILELPKVTGYGLGLSMVAAGLCLAPGGLVMIVISPISARISATKGPKVSLLIGTVIATGGYALGFALIHSVWEVILVGTVIGSGIAFAYAAMPALISTRPCPPSSWAPCRRPRPPPPTASTPSCGPSAPRPPAPSWASSWPT